MPDEEDLWIERARRGDVESFSRVVLLRQGYVRAFLGRFTGHPDVVDDLAQETFLRAWRKLLISSVVSVACAPVSRVVCSARCQ